MKTSGEIIKEYRQKNKLTVLELADKIEVSQVFMTYLENDKRTISEKTMAKFRKIMSKEEIDNLVKAEEYKQVPEKFQSKLLELEKENKNLKNKLDPRIDFLSKKEKNQLEDFLGDTVMFFQNEDVSLEDKEKLFNSLQDAFFEIKIANKRKK